MLVRRPGVPMLSGAMDLGRTAIGTWSGGRFMHFGEALDEDRFTALVRPGHGIRTVLTADVYGEGEADRLLGQAVEGIDREDDAVHPRLVRRKLFANDRGIGKALGQHVADPLFGPCVD